MVKKWTIAAIAYLVLVMAGYTLYSLTFEPSVPSNHIKHDK